MRKISSIIATTLMASLLFAGVAQAETGTIENTGPGSHNVVEFDSSYTCEVKNNNDVEVDNDSDQTAGSGGATIEGNTTGGSATTGSAGNTNTTKVEVDLNNGGCEAYTPLVPTTPTTPTTPGGGRGAGQVSGASTTAAGGGRGAGQQVAAPVGGVGAGTGGLVVPAVVVSLLTAAVGARRLHRLADA